MERKAPSWFGFTLTQKQAVSLFVFALLGFLICTFVFVMAFTSVYMNFYYNSIDLYYMDDYYVTSMIISMLPILAFFFVIFLICCYTLSRCRKTAKFCNEQNKFPQIQVKHSNSRAPQVKVPEINNFYDEKLFCPNCGTKHGESYQFCVNCGYSLI